MRLYSMSCIVKRPRDQTSVATPQQHMAMTSPQPVSSAQLSMMASPCLAVSQPQLLGVPATSPAVLLVSPVPDTGFFFNEHFVSFFNSIIVTFDLEKSPRLNKVFCLFTLSMILMTCWVRCVMAVSMPNFSDLTLNSPGTLSASSFFLLCLSVLLARPDSFAFPGRAQ